MAVPATGVRAAPRRPVLLLLAALLLPLLLPACASAAGDGGEGAPVRVADGSLLSVLPSGIGRVEFEDDPVLFVAGLAGMIGGAIAGGWLFSLAVRDNSGDGDAIFYGGIFAVLAGAVVGGLLVAWPVKGIEEFFKWLFG